MSVKIQAAGNRQQATGSRLQAAGFGLQATSTAHVFEIGFIKDASFLERLDTESV